LPVPLAGRAAATCPLSFPKIPSARIRANRDKR